MPTIANSNIPTPKGWDEFEDITLSVAKIRWGHSDFCRHGRPGQQQNGIDVYGHNQNANLIGIQCKNTIHGIDFDTITKEMEKATSFVPPVTQLFVATTASRDAKLQKKVRHLNKKRIDAGAFGVAVLFWEDICNDLTSDQDRFYQHYPQFKPAKAAVVEQTHDQKLFEEFQAILPFSPSIEMLRNHDFGNSFLRVAVQPLFNFVETWDSVDKEFIDKELEQHRRQLFDAACQMSSEICKRTVPVGDGSYASVLSDNVREQGGRRPEWVREDARELNRVASAFVPRYEEFIRYCRQTLNNGK